ncbi:MAG: UDP-glucose 4-epimerase GalE [Clostridia bacterium]|nr:UDP-glucose 4-epimerase GalE [Clostridia bacterium]
MAVLVTGGTGYIGSHTVVELLNEGKEVIIADNFSNSKTEVLDAIEKITGKRPRIYNIDCRSAESLEKIFEENHIDSVINFAGYKAVGESVKLPLKYYNNNLFEAVTLLEVMQKFNCKKFIFSSSATIYGDPGVPEYVEEMGRGKTSNPYGTTKAMIEQILEDLYFSDNSWNICILRYFNPIGAHESGILGENPNGIPNNLMPYIMKVASGKLEKLNIFGNDYDTKDGTGMRDYLHVVDLAEGHVKALDKLDKEDSGLFIYNLGTGTPYSVLDIVTTFEKVNNIKIPYEIVPRRPGDLAIYYANCKKANEELGWVAKKGIEDMCRDSWNFEKNLQ